MGFFSDLFDDIGDFVGDFTGRNQRKQVASANRLRISAQDRAEDELALFEDRIPGLLSSFDTQAGDLRGLFDDLFGLSKPGLLSGIRTRANNLFNTTDPTALINGALTGVNESEAASLASNQRSFDDMVRTGTANIAQSLNSRGLLNSTGLESQITAGLLPNAIGGRLAADAATRSAFSNLRANTALGGANAMNASRSAGAGLLGTSAGLESEILNRLFGTEAGLFNQRFGLESLPTTFRADRLVQPNALFREAVVGDTPNPLASLLGNVAGQVAPNVLGNLFPGIFG